MPSSGEFLRTKRKVCLRFVALQKPPMLPVYPTSCEASHVVATFNSSDLIAGAYMFLLRVVETCRDKKVLLMCVLFMFVVLVAYFVAYFVACFNDRLSL